MDNIFFSIIIPAHNEEATIQNTLEHLKNISYPPENYEIIIVENGSTDNTYEILKNIHLSFDAIKIYQCDKGVSRARNVGASKINNQSDWVIFLDADTVLRQHFLHDLAQFITTSLETRHVIGTTEIIPYNTTTKASLWFKMYDFAHKYLHTSYSIQICRADIVAQIMYDQKLCIAEDLQYILDAKKYGTFFFFPTKNVLTSTRRFDQTGYVRLFIFWVSIACIPKNIQKRINYRILR